MKRDRTVRWWERISRRVEIARAIRATHDVNTNVVQQAFAWGDPGTESGHTINALNTDLSLAEDGNGDQDHFLRFEIEQDENNPTLDLTWTFRVQMQENAAGWGTAPTTAGSNKAHIVDHASITQGDDTTNRVSSSAEPFVTNNNGVCDTSADTGPVTWSGSGRGHIEILVSVRFNDANLSAGDSVHFRIVRDDDTVLDGYTVADATMDWSAPAAPATVPHRFDYQPYLAQ